MKLTELAFTYGCVQLMVGRWKLGAVYEVRCGGTMRPKATITIRTARRRDVRGP